MPDAQPGQQNLPLNPPPPAGGASPANAAPPAPVTPPGLPADDKPPASPPAEPTLLGGDKPTEGDKGTPGDKPPAAPPDIEVKFPEGFQADAEFVSGFKGLAKDLGLKQEQAQKAADFYTKVQTELAKKAHAETVSMHTDWKKASETDKEFGGEAFKQNVVLANNAFKKFASPELQQILVGSKLASHPEVLRLFYRLGKQDAEPSRIAGGAPVEPQNEEARLRKAYPNSPQMFSNKG